MAVKTYKGSCHCGKVKFEADIDLAAGSGRCNCTFCTKIRNWGVFIKPDSLRVISGEDEMIGYKQKDETPSVHTFCKTCGVRTFERGFLEPLGGDYVAIQLSSLDDVSIEELMSGTIRYSDGRNNNWMNSPVDTRNL
ncbi:GFA family protein [Candidatus Kaiserbacteria bacterium]|nr:GFA family protein [Candidatus Kaiserbacteria bacterium]